MNAKRDVGTSRNKKRGCSASAGEDIVACGRAIVQEGRGETETGSNYRLRKCTPRNRENDSAVLHAN